MGRSKEEAMKLAKEQLEEKYRENLERLNNAKRECSSNMRAGKNCQAVIDENVLFNLRKFDFQNIYLIDKSESRSFGDMMQEDVNLAKERSKMKDSYNQQSALSTCLKTYLGLKYRSEHKPFLEKLAHPFMSIRLFFQKLSMKSMLKNDYHLSDKAIDLCESATRLDFDQKRDIGYIAKNGDVFKYKATDKEIKALAEKLEKGDDLASMIDKDLAKDDLNKSKNINIEIEKEPELEKNIEI